MAGALLVPLSPALVAQTPELSPGGSGSAGTHTEPPELSLDEALRTALDGNPVLELARTDLALAENQVSLGAVGFLPRIQVGASRTTTLTNSEQTFIEQDPRRLRNAETQQTGGQASLTWRVFDGLDRFAELDRYRAQERREAYGLEDIRDTVLTGVVLGYHDLARRQQQVRILEEAVELSEERLRLAELRRELGSASDLEVRQARVDRNADRAAVIRERTDLTQARVDFNRLLGRSPDREFQVDDDIRVDRGLSLEELREGARSANPEILGAMASREAADHGRREARSGWFPSVDLQAGVDYTNLTSESGFQQALEGHDFFVGLSLSFDVFDGFERNRRGEEARLRVRGADAALRDAELRVDAEVETHFARYRDELELVALEEENLEIARQNVETALEQFEVGTISSIELREVQEALIQAETRLLEAEFGARAAEAELLRLTGQVEPDR